MYESPFVTLFSLILRKRKNLRQVASSHINKTENMNIRYITTSGKAVCTKSDSLLDMIKWPYFKVLLKFWETFLTLLLVSVYKTFLNLSLSLLVLQKGKNKLQQEKQTVSNLFQKGFRALKHFVGKRINLKARSYIVFWWLFLLPQA